MRKLIKSYFLDLYDKNITLLKINGKKPEAIQKYFCNELNNQKLRCVDPIEKNFKQDSFVDLYLETSCDPPLHRLQETLKTLRF